MMNESVKSARAEQLARFRAQTPPLTLTFGDATWTVYDTQEGAQSVLLLPAGGAPAEVLFPYVQALRPFYRVLAVELPPNTRTLDAAVLGVVGVLDARGVDKAHVVGLSWGALLAQMLLRGQQARIIDAVLGFGFVPNAERAVILKQQLGLMRLLPSFALLPLLRRTLRQAIAAAPQVTAPERAFWQSYYDALYHQPTLRQRLLAHLRLSVAFAAQTPFQTKDIAAWQGRLLLIEAEDDEVVDEGQRGAFKGMYPRAYVRALTQGGHLAPVLQCDTLAQSVLSFLRATP